MRFNILTIFPEVFEPYLETSILGRAKKAGLIEVNICDIRDFAEDKHKTVDDTPYGGGAGMVMKIAPIAIALDAIKSQTTNYQPLLPFDPAARQPRARSRGELKAEGKLRPAGKLPTYAKASAGRQTNSNDRMTKKRRKTIVLSARGEQFKQVKAKKYAKLDELTLICGRYEGIDQRVADHLADEELSIGSYVLSGGELPALVVIEAVTRLLPGVLGNPESLKEESYGMSGPRTTLGSGRSAVRTEYPQYTKPEEYRGWPVPKVLLSGDHDKIRRWRAKKSK